MPEAVRRPPVEFAVALAAGAGLLWLATLLVPPAAVPFPGHGERFAAMAEAPFAFDGAFPQRVLWPASAWLVARVGIGPVVFSHGCLALLLAGVCWVGRRRGLTWPGALLVGAVVAVTGAVLVFLQPMACFSDPLSLLLLLLAVDLVARPTPFWLVVLLAAFAHELVFFFAPWLLYLRCRNGGRWRRELAAFALVLGGYALFRVLVPAGPYGVRYYLDNNIWVPWGLPLMWLLWGFLVLVEFGPVLLVAGHGLASGEFGRRDTFGGRAGFWLYLAGIAPLMVLAYDVMRFAAFALLPVVFGAIGLARSRRGRGVLIALLAVGALSYRHLHPVPEQQGGAHFTMMSGEMQARFGLLVTRTAGDAWQFTLEVLAATAAMWGWALAGGLALAAGSWLLARYAPATASPAGSTPRTQHNASP